MTAPIMLLMQYRVDLDDDHDMRALRARIAAIGAGFDTLNGLVQKAFLVSTVQQGRTNRYAPFYVWRDEEAMRAFLVSESFARVCAKYGRPSVQSWLTVYSRTGDASRMPRHATQAFVAIDPYTDLSALAKKERDNAQTVTHGSSLHSLHVGFNPASWQLVRTSFWHATRATEHDVDAYDIEYLAFPRLEPQLA